ncbi:MAG: hypothetical protein ACJ73N_03950, partial [Bryobacteraceae bacterium]
EVIAAASTMGLQVYPMDITAASNLENAFAAMSKAGAQALIVLTDPILFSERQPSTSPMQVVWPLYIHSKDMSKLAD